MSDSLQFLVYFLILKTFTTTCYATKGRSKIIIKREYIKYDDEVIEKAKSGIFYFKVMSEAKFDGKNIFDHQVTDGTGFCTVYENEIYFITRDTSLGLITRLHRKDLINPRSDWEYFVENNIEFKRAYCQSREDPNYSSSAKRFKLDVYIVVKSNEDDRWLKLKVENSMLHNDLAILRFEDATSVDPNSCLKFDESGTLPQNGTVKTFVRHGKYDGSVIEGKVGKVEDKDCRTYFQVSFPSIKTNISTHRFNSGSPLLNQKGKVVGIDGQEDVNESLMGNTLARLIRHHHKRNKSGLYKIDGIDLEFKRDPSYVGISVIDSTNKHFKKGDIIKKCSGIEIRDTKSFNQLLLFSSNDQPSFNIDCVVTRNNGDVDTRGLVKEMEPEDVIKFHKQLHCVDGPIKEYDFNSLRGRNINDYLFLGMNIDCANLLRRPINYVNPLERTIEAIRSTSLFINTTILVNLGNKQILCNILFGSAFITKQNGNFYVVSSQDVIPSKSDSSYEDIDPCANNIIKYISNNKLENRVCNDKSFTFDANFVIRAVDRNNVEFILKNPLRNVNSIRMLDVVITTFLNETKPQNFLEFATDTPKLNDDIISIGNQKQYPQTYSLGKVTENTKDIRKRYLGDRHVLSIWTHYGNSGAAIVRVKDKKVVGLDGIRENERTHSLSGPFLHKLVEIFDKHKRIMLFHPVGIQLKWFHENRNKIGAQVINKTHVSINQTLKIGDQIIKINNEAINNPDDVLIVSTLEAKNWKQISINNEKKYGCYVRMVVSRGLSQIALDNVPIAEMSNTELDDIEIEVTGRMRRFNEDFTKEVRNNICTKTEQGNGPITHTEKVTIKTVTKQSTKTVKKPDIKTTKTSTTSKSSKMTTYKTSYTTTYKILSESTSETVTDTSYTPVSSTVSTPSDVEYTLFSDPSTDIDTSHTSVSYDTFSVSTFYTSLFYTSASAGSTDSEYNVPTKPSTSNQSYVITVTVISTLFCIAFIILLIMVLRSIKIKIRLNCFGRRPSTENDLFDQSTLNESFKDKIKEFIKSNIKRNKT